MGNVHSTRANGGCNLSTIFIRLVGKLHLENQMIPNIKYTNRKTFWTHTKKSLPVCLSLRQPNCVAQEREWKKINVRCICSNKIFLTIGRSFFHLGVLQSGTIRFSWAYGAKYLYRNFGPMNEVKPRHGQCRTHTKRYVCVRLLDNCRWPR